ncbi:hypothetical protein E2P81_ATG05110 [Venturia nashicola]|uniref:Uncharacterized protein n=1 Tax=Venturia nashicola TaxID=86259 RepID=A0A4Z1P3A9_9PEZI|nr:hypothetical protein E6O75_ATG05238 [Venturia nashicola]TLD34945.1 hypothetical protein E2P81_ATG05110 [Venturia nashicola]
MQGRAGRVSAWEGKYSLFGFDSATGEKLKEDEDGQKRGRKRKRKKKVEKKVKKKKEKKKKKKLIRVLILYWSLRWLRLYPISCRLLRLELS